MFLKKHATHDLDAAERVRALKLLELQRHAMLMYTSCGWFFDELSGLETVQVLHYAGRAIQLTREAVGQDVEAPFCERLRNAKSNIPEYGDGEKIFKKWVAPAVITADKVAGHYAVSSLFETYGEKTRIYCYTVERQAYGVETEGRIRLAVGRGRIRSEITTEELALSFAILHLGDHNITGGVREFHDEQRFSELRTKLNDAFMKADTAEVIHILDEQFHRSTFSLSSLFRDEQRRIIGIILKDTVASLSGSFRKMYEDQAPLIRFLNSLAVPVPDTLRSVAAIALNSQLQQALEKPDIDVAGIRCLLREARLNNVQLDVTTLEFIMRHRLEIQATAFHDGPEDLDSLKRLHVLLDVAGDLPFPVGMWTAQNLAFQRLTTNHNGSNGNASDDPAHQEWVRELAAVSEKLHIHGPQ
jgi:hypothetical protein